jgi:hypothetical protein
MRWERLATPDCELFSPSVWASATSRARGAVGTPRLSFAELHALRCNSLYVVVLKNWRSISRIAVVTFVLHMQLVSRSLQTPPLASVSYPRPNGSCRKSHHHSTHYFPHVSLHRLQTNSGAADEARAHTHYALARKDNTSGFDQREQNGVHGRRRPTEAATG